MGFEETEETADYDGFYLPVVHVDRQGRVWVGDCDFQGESPVGQGARWFDGNTWVGDDTPVNDGCVMDIESDRQGRIWIGLDQELWRYNPEENNWTSIDPPDAPAGRFGWIQDLEFDQNGELWPTFIGCGGASCDTYRLRYHLQGNEWNQIDDLGDYKDQGILFDPSGGAWLMGNENIYQVRGESLREVSNLTVLAAAQDPEGWLWLAAEYQGRTFLWRQIPSNESP
jgi:ligand-binding sensor domain-containing protein